MATLSTVSHSFSFAIQASITNTLDSGKSASSSFQHELVAASIATGVSASQISRAWEETISLSESSSVTVDLRNMTGRDVGAGSGNDALGQPLTIEEVVCLVIEVTTGPGTLDVNTTLPTNHLSWVPQYTCQTAAGGGIGEGGMRVWFEPNTQGLDVETLEKNVRFDAVGGDVTFRVLVFGRHDDDESSSSSVSSSSSESSSSSDSSS